MTLFRKFLFTGLILVFALIFVGSLVRSTGSGLGCPDWPKCFGMWVPPLSQDELPANYKDLFKVAGKEIADFDALKTWTEYLNRLFGVFIGLVVTGLALGAWKYRKAHPRLFLSCLGVFLLTGVQGGIGAKVVSSHLLPYMVSIHLVVAIIIVFLMIYAYLQTLSFGPGELEKLAAVSLKGQKALATIFILTLIQMALGVQVREGVDVTIKLGELPRTSIVESIGALFYVHRSFSLAIVLGLYWVFKIFRSIPEVSGVLKGTALTVLALITSGVVLAYFGLPMLIQPFHLLFACTLTGQVFYLLLKTRLAKNAFVKA